MSFLPGSLRDYMSWNAMMTMFEMARYGQFQQASDKWIYPGYVISVIVFLTFWGLVEIRRIQRDIHVP
jgi:capsular polysaccharide transport system permease protein